MQQDWKAIWDNLNPDEAAKERMKQAILQKIQAETPQTASKKPPFFLQRCSFGTFARAAALCCMTVTVALAGLHLTDRRTAELLPEPSVSEQPAETTTPHTLPAQTTATLQTQTTTKTQTQTALQTTATAKQTVTSPVNSCIISGSHRKTRCRNQRTVKRTDSDRANLYRTRTRSHNNSCGNKCNRSTRNHDHHNIPWS